MDPQEVRGKLGGAIGFPITPFKEDYTLDLEAVRKNTADMLKFDFCAIVAAGGTGELYSLTPEEHKQIVQATIEETAGKVPVIAGTGFGGGLSVELAKQAEEAGADGLLMFAPYYPNADFEGLVRYYKGVADATSLAVFIYSRDSVNLTPGQVARLAEEIPTLIALKEGLGDIRNLPAHHGALRRPAPLDRRGRRRHGPGILFDRRAGPTRRAFRRSPPRLSLQLHERASMLDNSSLSRLMSNYVLPLYAMRSRRRGYEVSIMKAAMEILGKPAGPPRPPLPQIRPQEREELEKLMAAYDPVLSKCDVARGCAVPPCAYGARLTVDGPVNGRGLSVRGSAAVSPGPGPKASRMRYSVGACQWTQNLPPCAGTLSGCCAPAWSSAISTA